MGSPALVKIVSVAYLVLGIIGVGSLVADLPFAGFVGWGLVAAFPIYGVALVGIPQLILSLGLWKQKRWAYWLTIVFSLVGIGIALYLSNWVFLVLAILAIAALGISHRGYFEGEGEF